MRYQYAWVVGVAFFVVAGALAFVGCESRQHGGHAVSTPAGIGYDPALEPGIAANAPSAIGGVPRGYSPVGAGQNTLGLTDSLDKREWYFRSSGKWSDTVDPSVQADESENEELWIIPRDATATSAPSPSSPRPLARRSASTGLSLDNEQEMVPPPLHRVVLPRTGCLVTTIDDEYVPMPLEHTDVCGSIVANIAAVDVTQRFSNPYASKIEAVYVFPLPDDAAVSGFVMTIGSRHIRGIIREREDAERLYAKARAAGRTASLLTQERPNIFTQSVANIEPGRGIDVDITYFHTLAYRDGWYEFVFPMVVGPRYNPPGTTDGVGAAERHTGARNAGGQETEVQYLAPRERSGHDIALSIDIDAGVPIDEIVCASHRVEIERDRRRTRDAQSRARVSIARGDTLPNKDFVLRYRVAGDDVRSAIIAQAEPSRGERGGRTSGGYFTMTLVPPRELARQPRTPMELIFVLDCSGSMSGQPLTQAKAAVREALGMMTPDDTFQIIRFSESASAMGTAPIRATAANVRRGVRYVDSLSDGGGTEMIEGIRAALSFPNDGERLRFVVFLTDGFIGNEPDILAEVHRLIGRSRVFSFGVGSSPNRFLLDRMAKMGRGSVAYLGPNDDGGEVMRDFFTAASHPALTDIEIDWSAMAASDVFPGTGPVGVGETPGVACFGRPSDVPDLFVGRPVVLSGRFEGPVSALPRSVRVRARVGGSERVIDVPISTADSDLAASAMQKVWARQKILAMDEWSILPGWAHLADGVQSVALRYGLMSSYTAFIAVDSAASTEGASGTTVKVAVPTPDGTRYDTTVEPAHHEELGVWRDE